MIESFKGYLSRLIPLEEAEFSLISGIAIHRELKKKELFVQNGEICNKVLFFDKGYFRFFHFDYNGNEITSDFIFAPGFVTSYTSFLTGKPSFVNVQSMDDTKVLEFRKADLYSFYDRDKNVERLGRLIAESVAKNSEEHLFLLLNQPAEIRYKNLIDNYPEFIKTIPLQYIASYLGITQETLSRMRKTVK
ncbi:MAG TPA: Crp/Fnr family transcriptional regulator [Prolixibacteraceae bacterium]|nr:Crp/Fnr family transcriptional regulator [Prolixibacteraceae bacterium]HPS11638.1 Crp/Fnr family transcriptional regulator [Prolixibacteraceae bacterium]